MTDITVFDSDADRLQKIADDNDMTVAEVFELLVDFADDMKRDYKLI